MKDPDAPEDQRAGDEEETAQRGRNAGMKESENDPELAAQEHSAERYRSFFEKSPEGIVFVDRGGTIIEANQAFCDLFGSHPAEIVGKDIESFYAYSGDREQFRTGDPELRIYQEFRMESSHFRRGREEFPRCRLHPQVSGPERHGVPEYNPRRN